MRSKKIGNPEQFDISEESPETNWGKKFRSTRLVFRKKDGDFEFHTYGGDDRANIYIQQLKTADEFVDFDDFDYIRLYTTDNNPPASIVDASEQPVFSASFLDDQVECYNTKMHVQKQTHDNLIVCPDFNFSHWLDFKYTKMYNDILNLDLNDDPIRKVCWRGAAGRFDSSRKTRAYLCHISDRFNNYIDAKHVDNKNKKHYISLLDTFKNYKYMIDMQAYGFSGRLKYLLLSGRLVFLQCRFHKAFYEKNLEPWVHYVPVAGDLSDIVHKIKWAIKNEDECNQIIKNATDFATRIFHPHQIYTTWKNLLNNNT